MVVCLKGAPCKVMDVSISKTGKHGHAKASIVGVDIFTGKKYQDMAPTSHNLSAPFVSTTKYTVMDVDEDNFLSLMSETGDETRDDIKLPEGEFLGELGEQIKKMLGEDKTINVTVTKAMGTEVVTALAQ
jgi:translation initiation factor 5A